MHHRALRAVVVLAKLDGYIIQWVGIRVQAYTVLQVAVLGAGDGVCIGEWYFDLEAAIVKHLDLRIIHVFAECVLHVQQCSVDRLAGSLVDHMATDALHRCMHGASINVIASLAAWPVAYKEARAVVR